jgi:hypothetical protein
MLVSHCRGNNIIYQHEQGLVGTRQNRRSKPTVATAITVGYHLFKTPQSSFPHNLQQWECPAKTGLLNTTKMWILVLLSPLRTTLSQAQCLHP